VFHWLETTAGWIRGHDGRVLIHVAERQSAAWAAYQVNVTVLARVSSLWLTSGTHLTPSIPRGPP